jgi:hypothetical protein
MGFNVRCGRILLAVDRNSIENCYLVGTTLDEIYLEWNNLCYLFQAHASLRSGGEFLYQSSTVAIVQTSINNG